MGINKYSERDLNTNISELAHELIRELDLACRKVSIYTESHPLSLKALNRFYRSFREVTRFKKFLDLSLNSGRLYLFNIKIKNSVFSEHIQEYMQLLDIQSLLLDVSMELPDLGPALKAFSSRRKIVNEINPMAVMLEQEGVSGVLVNSAIGIAIFDENPKFTGDMTGGYTLRNIVAAVLGDDLVRLAHMVDDCDEPVEKYINCYSIDYHPELVNYLLPEVVSKISLSDLTGRTNRILEQAGNNPDSIKSGIQPVPLTALARLVSLHPELESIGPELSGLLEKEQKESPGITFIGDSSERIDQFLYAAFHEEGPGLRLEDFPNMIERMLRTGQVQRVVNVVNILISNLVGESSAHRDKALTLLKLAVRSARFLNEKGIIEKLIMKIEEYLSLHKETFEFSDLIWDIVRGSLEMKDGVTLSRVCEILSKRRERHDYVATYESAAVRKVVEEMNRPEVIEPLVTHLAENPSEWYPHVKHVFETVASEEAAYALSRIISHESRQVRLYVLKILSKMGKAALNVCLKILRDNIYFERPAVRRELPDQNWYIVRNAISVLGSLKDPEACRGLGMRLSDDDFRVRRAIVSALESIGGESSADLLLLMADDSDREIRESAMIALGLIKVSDMTPELIEFASRRNSEIIGVINALGQIGGGEAVSFLRKLLCDSHFLSEYSGGKNSRDDIRLAAIRAIGKIGSPEASIILHEFKDSLSTTNKILLGGGRLAKAASEALSKLPS